MSELPPSALPMKPQDGVHQSMCLQLHNNNNFLKSSSASSASSASSSPDSTYSLSSLDVELPEGMMGRKAAASEDDSGIQSPDCRPDENDNSVSVYLDANEEEYDNTIIQNHENDNVFSDAGVDGERGRRGSVDSSATEAQLLSSEDEDEEDDSFLSLRSSDVVMSKRSESEEVQMCSSNHSPTVGLVSELYQEAFQDSVDLPNEEGQMCSSTMMPSVGLVSELHQEASQVFYNEESKMQRSTNWTEVDLGSELHQKAHQEPVELHKKEEQMQCSDRSLNVGSVSLEVLQESVELQDEEIQIQTSAQRPNVDLVTETHQETVQATVDLSAEKSPAQPPAELVLNQTMLPSVSQGAPSSSSIQNIKDPPCFPKRNTSQNTNDPSDISHTTSAMEPPKTKSTKMELKRFSRPNLKDVKPKVISRATSAPRPVNTDQSCEKNPLITRSRAANRREQGDDGVKKNRGSATQARATMSTTISDSDSKSTWPLMVKKQPPEFPGSKVVTNDCHVQTSSKVTETVRDERGNHHSEVEVDETPRDGDVDQTVSSDLRPPGVIARVQSRGGVSAGVRAATLAGVPKMRVIDSNPSTCGSAPSWKPPLKSASSKLPIKSGGLPMNLSSSSVGGASENKGAVQVMKNEEVCVRPSSSSQGKSACTKPAAGVRNRANTPAKPNTAGQKVIQSKTTQSALQRGGAVRPSRNSATVCPSSRGPRGTRPVHTHTEEEEEKKNRSILQLRSLVTHGNRKLEALAVVIQHIFNEREEALKQKKEISIQLKNLREELAQSVVCCERLECEKASVCAQLDAAVLALQQQHQVELTQLEDRLRDFYSAEWDKAHQVYQDEADRCTALMRQQVEEVKSKQEALRTEQEVAHSQQIEELRQGYEAMLAELYNCHERDRQELDNTLKRSEAALNERIVSLTEENETLSERLRETEEKRKALADKSQRDSRVVYLEQELDSLKVVLDIKTNQLHQQDKKLMQMDKLIETNVKLEEFVTKLKQENEDYKARMDKHAELSRQLSTEQAMLQQTLQKESKTNKRLSMENEELLWKLHNGLSPRNSASFPSSPVSPR